MSADRPAEAPPGWRAGHARHLLDSVDSTNAEALRRAPGLAAPAWIVAATQTGGRGRRGRAWDSPRGNLHATLLLHPAERAETVALRSFVAALALRDACAALTGLPGAFALKWPNDVLLNGGKLAGILLESGGQQGGRVAHLAIGFGVNLIAAPDPAGLEAGALPPVSLLEATGLRLEPAALLDALAAAYAGWEAVFVAEGFTPVRAAWLAGAANLGRPVRARTGSQTRHGLFQTVDATGALVLLTAEGRVAIPAAEVFF